MNWKRGQQDEYYYAYCMVGDANGILAHKLDACMQEKYGVSSVRCASGELHIHNWTPLEPYNFYICCVDEKLLEEAMNDAEEIYSVIEKTK